MTTSVAEPDFNETVNVALKEAHREFLRFLIRRTASREDAEDISVAGVRADMRGHFLHVDRPNNVSWTGVAEYRLLGGLVRFRVPQSGIVKLEPREDGVMMSHDMFIDFPDTWLGKLVARYFTKSRNVEKRLYEHGQTELAYFKTQIERLGKQRRAPTEIE